MDKKDIKTYEDKIKFELETVQKELQTVGRKNPANLADWEALPEKMDILNSDDNEVADSIESYEENTAILKQLEIRFNELKTALEKIKNDSYGLCEVCKTTIEPDRLEANPAAKTCKKHI